MLTLGKNQVTPLCIVTPVHTDTGITDSVMTVTAGTWIGNPTTFTYQAYMNGAAVANTGNSYTRVEADDGKVSSWTVKATNRRTFGTVTSIPAPATIDATASIRTMDGICAYWNAKGGYTGPSGSTPGATIWPNQVGSPADGAEKVDYDLWLGIDNTTTNDPVYEDNHHFAFSGSAQFTTTKAANPVTVSRMHKGTYDWTIWAKIKTGTTLGFNAMFGTAATLGDTGVVIRADSSGNLKVDQYQGGVVTTKYIAGAVQAGTVYDVAISYNHITNQLSFALNSSAWTVIAAAWNQAVTAEATYLYRVGANGANGLRLAAGCEMQGAAIFNKALSQFELATLMARSASYFTAQAPAAPAAPTSLLIGPGDGIIGLNCAPGDNNNSPITDYWWEYKAAASGTWLTFAHTSTPEVVIDGLTNGTSYNTRVSATNAIGTSPVSATSTATPVAAGTLPYNLTWYKTTDPVNADGLRSGAAREWGQPALLTHRNAFFNQVGNELAFICPDGGATTTSASYARSELRHLVNTPLNTATDNWMRFRVIRCGNGLKIVTHQIHGDGVDADPWIKEVITGKSDNTGQLRAIIQPAPSSTDATHPVQTIVGLSGLVIGDYFDSGIIVTVGNVLEWWVAKNGGALTKAANVQMYRLDTRYYKLGLYFQTAAKTGDWAEIRHMACPYYVDPGDYTPATPDPTPVSSAMDLDRWKITLPVDINGLKVGVAVEEKPVGITYQYPGYFDRNFDGSVTYTAPSDGSTTSGSHYPRSELRELKVDGSNADWTVADGGTFSARCKVQEVSTKIDKVDSSIQFPGRTVIGQIHGPADELIRLYYDGASGLISCYDDKYGSSQVETQFFPVDGSGNQCFIPFDQYFDYTIVANADTLTLTIIYNNVTYVTAHSVGPFWLTATGSPPRLPALYFKAGCYNQVGKIGSSAGSTGTGQAKVTFSRINDPTHP